MKRRLDQLAMLFDGGSCVFGFQTDVTTGRAPGYRGPHHCPACAQAFARSEEEFERTLRARGL